MIHFLHTGIAVSIVMPKELLKRGGRVRPARKDTQKYRYFVVSILFALI